MLLSGDDPDPVPFTILNLCCCVPEEKKWKIWVRKSGGDGGDSEEPEPKFRVKRVTGIVKNVFREVQALRVQGVSEMHHIPMVQNFSPSRIKYFLLAHGWPAKPWRKIAFPQTAVVYSKVRKYVTIQPVIFTAICWKNISHLDWRYGLGLHK